VPNAEYVATAASSLGRDVVLITVESALFDFCATVLDLVFALIATKSSRIARLTASMSDSTAPCIQAE
jgi:hypothetical protein